jgi:hypothetical protein
MKPKKLPKSIGAIKIDLHSRVELLQRRNMVGLGSPLVGTAQPVFGGDEHGDFEQGDGPIYESSAGAGATIANMGISEI